MTVSGSNVPAEIENRTHRSHDYSFHSSFHSFHIGNRES
jgi:hypothetical protein